MRKHLTNGCEASIIAPLFFVGISLVLNLFGPDFPLETLHFLRPFLSVLFLFPFVYLKKPRALKPSKNDLIAYAAMGFVLAISIASFNIAMVSAPIGTMTILANSGIFIVMLLSFLFLGEKVTRRELFAAAIAFIGIIIINPLEPTHSLGAGLILLSALSFSIVIIMIREEENNHTIGIALWYLLFASAFLFPFALASGFDKIGSAWWLVLLIGLLNAGAYLIKTYSLKYETADLVQIITLIVSPLAAITLGIIVLGQTPTPNILTGGAIMVAAGVIISKEIFK